MTPRSLRRAEIIAVGSEMLLPDRTDTNSLFITGLLNQAGIEVNAKSIVGDHLETLASVFGQALARADLVVLTGGLGPTDDDMTRDAVAQVLGRGMTESEAIVRAIRERFERRGMAMPDINRRQARVIDGAEVLANAFGTAPGQWIERDGQVVVLLPGPPRELKPMFEQVFADRLVARASEERLHRRTVRIIGRSESHAEEALRPLYAEWAGRTPAVAATILAARGMIELQLSARSVDPAAGDASVERAVHEVAAAFGPDTLSTDGRTLEEVIGDLLRSRGARIALAESCTGGLAAVRLTEVPGSSEYVERGIVAYSNATKVQLLGVPEAMLAEHGAVSEPVALAMAEGARRSAGVDVGLGITGIAGPAGGTDAKPVGTVVVAVAGPGDRMRVRTLLLPGGRAQVRLFSSSAALDMVRRALLQP